jgi:hypothetical protein
MFRAAFAPFSRIAGAMHYLKVVSAAKGDFNIIIHPLARSAGEGAGGEGR